MLDKLEAGLFISKIANFTLKKDDKKIKDVTLVPFWDPKKGCDLTYQDH